MPEPRGSRRAALLVVAAMGLYAANDACMKATAASLAPGQVLTLRGALACLVLAAITPRLRLSWRQWMHWSVPLRCLMEFTAAATSLLALSRIPLATAAAIMMIAPVLAMLASFAMRWEPWRPARLGAVLCGLAGVLLVLRPDAGSIDASTGSACALLCAASLAARDLLTRRIPLDLPSAGVAGLATAFVCLGGIAMGSGETWTAPPGWPIVLITLAAVCSALGNYALVRACRDALPSQIAPLRYTLLLWSGALGYVIWGELPGWPAVAGMGLIVVGGTWAHLRRGSGPRAARDP